MTARFSRLTLGIVESERGSRWPQEVHMFEMQIQDVFNAYRFDLHMRLFPNLPRLRTNRMTEVQALQLATWLLSVSHEPRMTN